MSNCINIIRGEKVVFLSSEIDAPAFKEWVDKAPEDSIPWWYLQQNSIIDRRGAVIMFGEGRSTHTNRSFDALLLAMAPFMKVKKYHTFFITEEGDGHRQVYREIVEFKEYAKQLAERDARIQKKIDAMNIDYSKMKVRTLGPNGWVEGDAFGTGLQK